MKKLLLAALAAFGLFCAPANAAQDQVLALVVTTCGTLATPYIAGKYGILTMDTTGKLCNTGGTQPVSGTVTANQGAAGASPWLVTAGGYDFQLAPTITVQNAAYSAGNSEGGLITVTGAARINGGSGVLNGLRLKSTGGSTNTIWIYAWSKTPAATCTDKSTYVANAADQPYAIVGFPASLTLGGAPGAWDTATYAQLTNQIANFKNQDSSPGTAIYLCLVTAGTVTPATTADLSAVLGGMQD